MNQRCPICASRGEEIKCRACHTAYHQECWDYNQGCAIYGCHLAGVFVEPPTKTDILHILEQPHVQYVEFHQNWTLVESVVNFGVKLILLVMFFFVIDCIGSEVIGAIIASLL